MSDGGRAMERTAYEEEAGALAWGWWFLLIVGLLSVAAGAIILAKPSDSLTTLSIVAGIFLLIDGILELANALLQDTPNRGLIAIFGVITAVVGVLLIRHPLAGVTAVALLIGIWLIAVGVVRLVRGFEEEERRGWHLIVGAIELIAGIVIVAVPDIGLATLALLVGISFIVNGIGMVAMGWGLHELRGVALRDAGAKSQRPSALPH